MIDTGLSYIFTTPNGSFTVNPASMATASGFFNFGVADVDKTADSDVSARGFGDGSIFGRTRLPGLRYGLSIMAYSPVDATRELLENQLRGYIDSMRGAEGSVAWTAKDGTNRNLRGVRALSVPRPTDRVGVYKTFAFEIGAPRHYVEGDEVQTVGTALTATGGGLVFSTPFPWIFTGSGGGVITCPNPGYVDEYPKIRINGPIVSPAVIRVDTQDTLFLDGLSIADGDYVDIDLFAKTVLINGSINGRNFLRPTVSKFFSIPAGGTVLQLTGSSVGANTLLTSFTRGAFPS